MDKKEETRKLLRKYGDELLAELEESVDPWQLEYLNKLVDQTIEEVLEKTADELDPYEGLDFSAVIAARAGLKPDELAPPLPNGPLDGHKSWAAMFPRKYPDVNWPPEGTTVETTISDDGDTQVDVIKREGVPDLTIVHQGLNEDDPIPLVMSESLAKKLNADLPDTIVLVEGECTNKRPLSEETKACMKYHGHVAEDFMGGQAVEYPSSATIDLRKDEDVSGPVHLGPIDLGPTDGERLEEHLLQSEDKKRRFAANACEASAND